MADKIPLKLSTGPNEIQEFAAGDTVPVGNLPNTVVYTSGAQTLSAKVLNTDTVASQLMASSGTARVLELSSTGSSSDYSAVKVTTQTATNGAIVGVSSSATNADLKLQAKGSGTVQVGALGPVVGETGSQTLTNKILTSPTINGFTNAGHTHVDAANGGLLSTAAIGSGTWSQDRLADTANRTGSYAFGRGSAVLVDDSTAAGLSGTARWAQRPRVLQVQVEPYQVTGSNVTLTTIFSQFQQSLNASDGFSLNTTPDCEVDTTGTFSPTITTTSRRGKLLKITMLGAGQLGTSIFNRSFSIQTVVVNGASNSTAQIAQANITGAVDFKFNSQAYVLFTQAQNGSADNVYVWFTDLNIGDSNSGVPITGSRTFYTGSSSFAILNNDTLQIQIKAYATGTSVGSDFIKFDTVFYEALN